MKQKRLTVQSRILHDEDTSAEEVTQCTVPAMLRAEDGGVSFTYTEAGEGGVTHCHVRLRADGVVVRRRGASVCDMHFGQTDDAGVYEVPPFTFPFTLHTEHIRHSLTCDGGTLDIVYRMNLGGDCRRVHLHMTLT